MKRDRGGMADTSVLRTDAERHVGSTPTGPTKGDCNEKIGSKEKENNC